MQKPSRRRFHPRDGADSPLFVGEGLGVRAGGQKRFHFYLAAQVSDLRHCPAAMHAFRRSGFGEMRLV